MGIYKNQDVNYYDVKNEIEGAKDPEKETETSAFSQKMSEIEAGSVAKNEKLSKFEKKKNETLKTDCDFVSAFCLETLD